MSTTEPRRPLTEGSGQHTYKDWPGYGDETSRAEAASLDQRGSRRLAAYGEREDDRSGNPAKALALVGIGALAATAIGFSIDRRVRQSRPEDDAPERTALYTRVGDHALTGRTVTINKPASELYAFFRDFQNLPQVMENLVRVEPVSGHKDRNVWVIRAPAGQTVECETEVSEDREGELIAWRSVEGSQIETSGHVRFRDAPANRGTEVELVIDYKPPLGAAGRAVALLFQREPHVQSRRDLKRFKMLMETGELATSARRRADREAGL
jgi:uncharacterized membrane protein